MRLRSSLGLLHFSGFWIARMTRYFPIEKESEPEAFLAFVNLTVPFNLKVGDLIK